MKTKLQFNILGLLLIILSAPLLGQTIFTVTNTNDDGAGSLRQAIIDCNGTSGTDTIAFNIPGAGPHTIQPLSALPFVFDPVVIDGTTEPDFTGTPIIELDGSNVLNSSGLIITAGNSTVKGLVINRFGEDGIRLASSGGNIISRNYIGTDVTGTIDLGNLLNGILILNPSHSNLIGGLNVSDRNIISGNDMSGVNIYSGTYNNTVYGNYIGTDVTGTIGLGNGFYGVSIVFADNNTIGGTTAGARNVISGNNQPGILIFNSSNNTISSNYIGTDSNGTTALGNVGPGIAIGTGSQFNIIGGITEGERNIISGNGFSGVEMWNPGANNNTISGNYIGTDITGTVAIGGQSLAGIFIGNQASQNTIGGTTIEERNIISGNDGDGIWISDSGTTGNIVLGNFIGTNVTGTEYLGNNYHGVLIVDASYNIIGGTTDSARNIISANLGYGIRIQGNDSQGNLVQGNYIGTDYSGMAALPNLSSGVIIRSGAYNIIGGKEVGSGNVISGNQVGGIYLGFGANNNTVEGNLIGTDVTGEGALGNGSDGVSIFQDAVDNIVGGDEEGAGNIIAFNTGVGVIVNNVPAPVRNRISRNSIFSNGFMGIDLSLNTNPPFWDGITPNDPGDPDIGSNNLQNFPVITSADIDISGDLLIGYNVDSEPVNSTYPLTIEFFESDTSGQGETFVGTDQYTVTDFNNGGKTVNIGNADSLSITDNDFIVATTTDSVDNTSEFSSIDTVVTEISETVNHLPEFYALHQNYPNPFNPNTKIKYQIPELSLVILKVYDVLGNEIATLVNDEKQAGHYEIEFDATGLSSGIYFYKLQVGSPSTSSGQSFVKTKKMLLLK